jgi:hypothetical protein
MSDCKISDLFQDQFYFGREGEGDEGEGEGTDDGDVEGTEGGQEGAGSASEDSSDDDDIDDRKELKGALANERKARKAAEKRATALAKEKEQADLAKQTSEEQAIARAEKAEQQKEKLAAGFLNRELESAIRRAARDEGFIDPADAIDGVDRNAMNFEQDEDDPSEVTIDTKSITKAVKALAAKKPHFIKSGTDDGEETGGKFGRGGKGDRKDTDYSKLYPAL